MLLPWVYWEGKRKGILWFSYKDISKDMDAWLEQVIITKKLCKCCSKALSNPTICFLWHRTCNHKYERYYNSNGLFLSVGDPYVEGIENCHFPRHIYM